MLITLAFNSTCTSDGLTYDEEMLLQMMRQLTSAHFPRANFADFLYMLRMGNNNAAIVMLHDIDKKMKVSSAAIGYLVIESPRCPFLALIWHGSECQWKVLIEPDSKTALMAIRLIAAAILVAQS